MKIEADYTARSVRFEISIKDADDIVSALISLRGYAPATVANNPAIFVIEHALKSALIGAREETKQ